LKFVHSSSQQSTICVKKHFAARCGQCICVSRNFRIFERLAIANPNHARSLFDGRQHKRRRWKRIRQEPNNQRTGVARANGAGGGSELEVREKPRSETHLGI